MIPAARELRATGVLGLNERNISYVSRYNRRRFYPLVDDKLLTKKIAGQANFTVPELYGVIEIQHDIALLEEIVAGHQDFVIKPAKGSGGEGVVIIESYSDVSYRTICGTLLTREEVSFHISGILSGRYSLGGQNDKALIEYRVKFDPVFEKVTYLGVPDVRIISLLGVPVMAMARLPTRASDGKANLHRGAIGVGIDLRSGTTKKGVWGNSVIDRHPDTGNSISGIPIPEWETLLALASRCHEVSGLGYIGVDFVLDCALGPLMLEMNARPGLNIQIANQCGLLPRLKAVEENIDKLKSAEDKVAFAKENFCG